MSRCEDHSFDSDKCLHQLVIIHEKQEAQNGWGTALALVYVLLKRADCQYNRLLGRFQRPRRRCLEAVPPGQQSSGRTSPHYANAPAERSECLCSHRDL